MEKSLQKKRVSLKFLTPLDMLEHQSNIMQKGIESCMKIWQAEHCLRKIKNKLGFVGNVVMFIYQKKHIRFVLVANTQAVMLNFYAKNTKFGGAFFVAIIEHIII